MNRVLVSSYAARHLNDVSDAHVLTSHALPPTMPDDERSARPRLSPVTVMLDDPAVPMLRLGRLLSDGDSIDQLSVTLLD